MDWRRAELIERAGEAATVRDLFDAVSSRLRRMVGFDSAVWLATDPATGLPTAPARSENMRHACKGAEDCMRVWENEFLVDDVNLYRDLAQAGTPAAGLRLASGDHPARSARYRDFMRPAGFGDELRATRTARSSRPRSSSSPPTPPRSRRSSCRPTSCQRASRRSRG